MTTSSNQVFCAIRREWVAAWPEEIVRQELIQMMTQAWGYPLGCLVLEKGLQQIPHLRHLQISLPKRRTDLVVMAPFHSTQYQYYPLLLVECKAVKLTAKMFRQAIGYNLYLKAPFIALINQNEAQLGCYHPTQQQFVFQSGFPSYHQLVEQHQKLANAIDKP